MQKSAPFTVQFIGWIWRVFNKQTCYGHLSLSSVATVQWPYFSSMKVDHILDKNTWIWFPPGIQFHWPNIRRKETLYPRCWGRNKRCKCNFVPFSALQKPWVVCVLQTARYKPDIRLLLLTQVAKVGGNSFEMQWSAYIGKLEIAFASLHFCPSRINPDAGLGSSEQDLVGGSIRFSVVLYECAESFNNFCSGFNTDFWFQN